MLSLTRKTDYALVAMAYLALEKRRDDAPISARQIAQTFNLPQPLLMNILKELGNEGLLESTRGIHGGYRLADDPAMIGVLDIVQIMEGPVQLTPCTQVTCESESAVGCCAEPQCPIRTGIQNLHEQLNSFLAGLTLADLIQSSQASQEARVGSVSLPIQERTESAACGCSRTVQVR